MISLSVVLLLIALALAVASAIRKDVPLWSAVFVLIVTMLISAWR